MLTMDADSDMTAAAVLRLVTAMRDDPGLGIIQHLTVGLPASSAFPRLFQFGMRAGMRTWATTLAWWQGDASVYWGHNAVVRIAPFRAHCKLPLLPNGEPILSHDQIEAAMLRGAGWGIRLLPEEDGSYEANPPALPEFMRRELRWLAGNFEYRHLLGMPGLRPMGRWQLIQAILLFASPPFYLVFLLAAAWAAATDRASPFPFRPALAATALWAGALYAPKLLGYLEVLLSRTKRSLYGGTARVLTGMALETVFILMLDAINVLAKTIATVRIGLGLRARWTAQNRSDRGVSWSEAARLLWPQTVLGLVVFAGFARGGWTAVAWAAPFAIGLVLAIPFCVLTAHPAFGAWLRERRLAAIPEELR
jgi:membrane glycosyltransferase